MSMREATFLRSEHLSTKWWPVAVHLKARRKRPSSPRFSTRIRIHSRRFTLWRHADSSGSSEGVSRKIRTRAGSLLLTLPTNYDGWQRMSKEHLRQHDQEPTDSALTLRVAPISADSSPVCATGKSRKTSSGITILMPWSVLQVRRKYFSLPARKGSVTTRSYNASSTESIV